MLGTIISLGDGKPSLMTPMWKCGVLLYFFAIAYFILVNCLMGINPRHQKESLLTTTVAMHLVFCVLIGVYEFWVKPAFVEYYQYLFGAEHMPQQLPLLTQIILCRIPSGVITTVVVCLSGVSIWQFTRQNDGELKYVSGIAQYAHFGLGLLFLIAVPIVLFLPLI